MKEKKGGTPAQYKSAIAGLTPAFAVIEVMFVAIAVYLFVAYADRPMYGGMFLIFAGVVLAVYLVMLFILLAKAKRAAGQEKGRNKGEK